MIDLALRCTAWMQRGLRSFSKTLERLKMELIVRQDIQTREQLQDSLVKAGWVVEPPEHTFVMPPPSGEECEECGAVIPDEDGGSIVNTHHEVSCSLYDDHINMNSGC